MHLPNLVKFWTESYLIRLVNIETESFADSGEHDQKGAHQDGVTGAEEPIGETSFLGRSPISRNGFVRSSRDRFEAQSIIQGRLMLDDPNLEPVLRSVGTRRT